MYDILIGEVPDIHARRGGKALPNFDRSFFNVSSLSVSLGGGKNVVDA
ncbi:MAG: hypothetical protein K0M60_02440 [Hydrogenophaga sp.]|nr:hypothetical protein [Hydrogenophaga sp.]